MIHTAEKRRDFISEIGLDDLGYELPGEDAEVEYEVEMLEGVQPDDEARRRPRRQHTCVSRIRGFETPSVDNVDDAVSEVEFIARELERFEEVFKIIYKQSEVSWLMAST